MRVRILSVLSGVLSTAALGLMFVTQAREARADVIFSNFGAGQTFVGNSWWDVGGVPGTPAQVVAFSFTPTETAKLTGADLALAGSNNPVTGTSPLNLFIESNSGGTPGTILDTLTQSGSYPTYPTTAVMNFTCSGSCSTLNAGTQYWIVGQQTDAANLAYWLWSFSDSGMWNFNQTNSATGPWTATTAGNFSAFDVTGTATPAVPEPASMALLGSGLLAIVAATRRRVWRC
ncbi:MAG TPA: choice-of-anchor R domain-containing protein [Acidobacteriaceae bacterium]|nr:choice-of-anchor R domain-containing protein [Acidobacteriaceae bacterium]